MEREGAKADETRAGLESSVKEKQEIIQGLEGELEKAKSDLDQLKESVPAPPLLEELGTQTTPKLAPMPPPAVTIETQTSPKRSPGKAAEKKKVDEKAEKEEYGDEGDDDEYGEDDDFEDEEEQPAAIPDPRPSAVVSSSDAIASTVISLRSTLQAQDETLDQMKAEIDALRTEVSPEAQILARTSPSLTHPPSHPSRRRWQSSKQA